MPIAAAFAPNYTLTDVLLACNQLLPWNREKLREGGKIVRFEEEFRKYMDAGKAISFESGRAGFYAILEAMGIGEGDEIILQAFTTVALPNTIRLFGARPVFVDIEPRTYNMDPALLEERITPRTKAILIQHTFGNPADLDRILEIAGRHGLLTIEDCAHSLGAKYKGEKTGSFADAAFFSFGRDKVISAVMGGMVIAKEEGLARRIEAVRDRLPYPEEKAVRKNLLHPLITFTALHTYGLFSLGKALMYLAQRYHLTERAYSKREKEGNPDRNFARRMPNALCAIGLHQLRLLGHFNGRRMKIAGRYAKNIKNPAIGLPQTQPVAKDIFLWYTITVPDKKRLIREAQECGLILGDWFPQAIGPIEADMAKAGYEEGSCPVAEEVSSCCVNLPTHHNIHRREAQRVIDFINAFK
jgi:dTDP-4-amino-4,6-dideoxygalactose transaminase